MGLLAALCFFRSSGCEEVEKVSVDSTEALKLSSGKYDGSGSYRRDRYPKVSQIQITKSAIATFQLTPPALCRKTRRVNTQRRTRRAHSSATHKLIMPGTPIYLPNDLRGENLRALASSERWWLRSIAVLPPPVAATCLPSRWLVGSSADESMAISRLGVVFGSHPLSASDEKESKQRRFD